MSYRSRAKQGQTALQDDDLMAAAIGDLGWLKLALRHRPLQSSSVDKNGFSTIHLAAMHGRLECLRHLIEVHMMDVNLPSQHGWRPIHLAISNQTGKRSYECFLYLLEKGANPTSPNDDGVTPLHQAACEGHIQCLKLLLEMQVPIDARDNRGNTPFDLARLWGHRLCAKLLTQAIWYREKRDVSIELETLRRKKLVEAIREIHDLQQSIIAKQRKDLERSRDAKDKQLRTAAKPKPATLASLSQKQHETSRFCSENLPISSDIRKAIQVVSQNDVRPEQAFVPNSSRKIGADAELANEPTMLSARWNPSTKVTTTFWPYEPSLKDIYPRDPFSKLPLPDATPTELNPRARQAVSILGAELHNGQPSRRLLSALDQINEGQDDETDGKKRQIESFCDLQLRPNVWQSNHVLDIGKLKKRDNFRPASDAGFCLTNDPKSYQIINSLCIDPSSSQ